MPRESWSEAKQGEVGPGYWDVSTLVSELEAAMAVRLLLEVVPPAASGPSRVWSPWQVRVVVCRDGERDELTPWYQESWGKGGTYNTFPAAAHAALRRLYDLAHIPLKRRRA